jgi:pyrroline-5-carboxylate reductase
MLQDKSVGLIGCGNMGSALVENLKKRAGLKEIRVFDIDKGKQGSLVKGFGVKAADGIDELAFRSEVLIVAVKPQDLEGVFKNLLSAKASLYISIAAGITLGYMESIIGKNKAIVRAMPNLNALIAESVTALSANAATSEEQKRVAAEIFESVGKVVFVREPQMNAVTAISGSGPAFVAYLMDRLSDDILVRVFIREAAHFGIDAATAKVLAETTVAGTKKMLKVNFDPEVLIKRVSSKGGTTEAGMKVLEERGKTEEALSEAIRAAEVRAAELSRKG